MTPLPSSRPAPGGSEEASCLAPHAGNRMLHAPHGRATLALLGERRKGEDACPAVLLFDSTTLREVPHERL
jgi:hypothetical protein